ncbi:hypothetical protein DL96DRAFT_1706766 [Flagelloscypha sp. PMI_526]|nr:hypothetical protein DL96DRAFT_1706766 [Flagelloscypha sp. PMI_526]
MARKIVMQLSREHERDPATATVEDDHVKTVLDQAIIMSTPEALPLEVLETIIDLSSAEDARSLALTSKALLPRSRANIFSHVVVTSTDRHKKQDIPRLFNLLKHSPDLEAFILHLSIINLHDITAAWSTKLVGILDRLQHMKTLSIVHAQTYFGCRWERVPLPVQSAVLKCVLSEGLKAVDAQFFGTCLTFLQACPKIKHLDLYSPVEAFTRSSRSSPRLVLESLRISSIQEPPIAIGRLLGADGDPLLDLSQLKVLACDSRTDQCSIIFGKWIAQIAESAGSSLRELYWDVSTPESKLTDLHVTLDQFPQLRVLSIVCHGHTIDPDAFNMANTCCSWIQKLMDSRNTLSPLVSSTFRVPWSDDPEPLENLITTIEGTQSAVFDFSNFPHPNSITEESREALEVLRKASANRLEINIVIHTQLEEPPLQHLRVNRPFTRIPLGSPWF